MVIHPNTQIHSSAIIAEDVEIGEGCVVWQFASILSGVVLGKNVSVGAYTEIGRGSIVGNDTRISQSVFLPSNSIVGAGCFFGPGARCADDFHPRANNPSYIAQPPRIDDGASIGMNASIAPGVHVGVGAMIGMAAVVTRDVPPHELVRGEPARVKPYSRAPSAFEELYVGPAVAKGDEHVA